LVDADLNAQLQGASAEIDSYLDGRGFSLPLSSWNDDLTSCCARIAAWSILTNLRGVNPDDAGHAGVRASAEDARKWLGMVSAGKANPLGLATARARVQLMQVIGSSDEESRGW
jgi:phage gp36-like protein